MDNASPQPKTEKEIGSELANVVAAECIERQYPKPQTEECKKVERLAMNIVYQLDDDANLSTDFRQANNDRRIDFVCKLLTQAQEQAEQKIISELIDFKVNVTEPWGTIKRLRKLLSRSH